VYKEKIMDDILHRKDRLIITTIDIIDEVGMQGLSTREIAKRQGVSEATLFRHYKSKNELLLAVLEFYSQYDKDIFQSTQLKKLSPLESIRFYMTSYMEYYENYPAITSIMMYSEVLNKEPEIAEAQNRIFINRRAALMQFVENAQKCEDITTTVDSEVIVDLMCGYIGEVCMRWRNNKYDFPLKERVLDTIDFLMTLLK
jgi:AcrR family transcriptional regulator